MDVVETSSGTLQLPLKAPSFASFRLRNVIKYKGLLFSCSLTLPGQARSFSGKEFSVARSHQWFPGCRIQLPDNSYLPGREFPDTCRANLCSLCQIIQDTVIAHIIQDKEITHWSLLSLCTRNIRKVKNIVNLNIYLV